MPFDYQKFDAQCSVMSTEQLLQQHHHYSKLSAGAATSTAVSALSIPLTLGLSGVAIGLSAPAHHNAKKKKQIVEKYMKARGIEAQNATMYANSMAQNDSQQKMWTDQQGWSSGGPSSDSKNAPGDQKYNYNSNDNSNSYSSSRSEKKEKNGISSRPQSMNPPPPPTYDEALNARSGYQGYSSPPPPQQQGYQSPPPQVQYNTQQNGWGQPQQQQQQQGMYGSPQGGYGGYNAQQQQQQNYAPPQGYAYNQNNYQCAPQSAMWQPRPGPDPRHVHFSSKTSLI